MRMRTIAILLMFAGAAAGQLGVPRIGCFVDDQRRLRPLSGVAANFLVGAPEAEEAISAACSGSLVLIKKDGLLEVRNGEGVVEWPAPGGPALFGFSPNGSAALVYYPETKEWFRVGRHAPAPLPAPEGEVVAIGSPEGPAAVVRRDGGLWIVGADERPAPPDAAEPLLLLPDGGLLYARGKELVLAEADGAERSFALPAAAEGLEWLGRGWVRVSLGEASGHLALALENRNELYRLPEVTP